MLVQCCAVLGAFLGGQAQACILCFCFCCNTCKKTSAVEGEAIAVSNQGCPVAVVIAEQDLSADAEASGPVDIEVSDEPNSESFFLARLFDESGLCEQANHEVSQDDCPPEPAYVNQGFVNDESVTSTSENNRLEAVALEEQSSEESVREDSEGGKNNWNSIDDSLMCVVCGENNYLSHRTACCQQVLCSTCVVTIKNKSNCPYCRKGPRSVFFCNKCNEEIRNSDVLTHSMNHMETVCRLLLIINKDNKEFFINSSPKTFRNDIAVYLTVKCSECKKNIQCSQYQEHLQKKHKRIKKCSSCGELLVCEGKVHCHENVRCVIPGCDIAMEYHGVENHMTGHTTATCFICNPSCGDSEHFYASCQEVLNHFQTVHINKECSQCRQSFLGLDDLEEHISEHKVVILEAVPLSRVLKQLVESQNSQCPE